MPAKIDHIWKNGQELKWCSKCKQFLPLRNFHTTNNLTWDNLYYLCIDCVHNKRTNNPRPNALSTWNGMCKRVVERPQYIRKKIQIRILKDEFVDWYIKNWFPRCRIDRINNEGHYELSNIQLLTQEEHNIKARQDRLAFLGVIEPEGHRYCYTCHTVKANSEFYQKKRQKSKGNSLGLDERCKVCDRRKRMEYYYKHKQSLDGKNILHQKIC